MLGMIWAQAQHRAIGKNGVMPWHIPEDMRFFRHMTVRHPVIMGRRTWESLGEKYRPLPGRTNIVVSHNPTFDAPGAAVVRSLNEALALALLTGDPAAAKNTSQHNEETAETTGCNASSPQADSKALQPTEPLVWVMGGAQIYAQALPLADFAVVTHVDLDVPGADAFAPEIPQDWSAAGIGTQVSSNYASVLDPSHDWNTSVKGTRYRFTVYARPGFTPPASLLG